MKLLFAGTRGNIESRSRRHRRHTCLRVTHGRRRVLIDCGADWLGRFQALRPEAIVLTHAHEDHAYGLRDGSACPVYATAITWRAIKHFPIRERYVIKPRTRFEVAGLEFQAFPVEHSFNFPAVGYRIRAGRTTIFYVPDVLSIPHRRAALRGVAAYIGDGATPSRPIIRQSGGRPVGHAPIRVQLKWCAGAQVPLAVFTHCGTAIVAGNERSIGAAIRTWAHDLGLSARIAYDGLRLSVPSVTVRPARR